MKCIYCNNEVDERAYRCPYCQSSLRDGNNNIIKYEKKHNGIYNNNSSKNTRKILIIAIVVFIVLIFSLVVILLLNRKSENSIRYYGTWTFDDEVGMTHYIAYEAKGDTNKYLNIVESFV